MTKVVQRVELGLRSFYIFNSQLGAKEGEESKKIIYYHPQDIELNTKIKDIGLSEAIISFTGIFTDDDACKALHTQKTTQLFYQPEKNYWMVLVLNVPKEVRSKEVEVVDYRGSEVHDGIYRAVLRQCYNMFRLFNGTFAMNVELCEEGAPTSHELLKQKLETFYNYYLPLLKLPASHVLDAMNSLRYLPLEKLLYLRVINFNSMIKSAFTDVFDTIFLYQEDVICSGISSLDLHCIHDYLQRNSLLVQVSATDAASASATSAAASFVSTPANALHTELPPKIYVYNSQKLECLHLIIYRALHVTLCLLVKVDTALSAEFYDELHSFMGPKLSALATDIAESMSKSNAGHLFAKPASGATICGTAVPPERMEPKYLFINEQSLRYTSNIHLDRCRPKMNDIPANVMKLIADLNLSHDTCGKECASEVQLKTTNDYWLVRKRCNGREFYVIIYNSKATLLDVTNEVDKIFEQQLKDDVFFDK